MKEFVVIDVDAEGEVETGIPFVDDFEVMELDVGESTYRKLVYLDPRMTIILWISDWSLIFSDYS